MNMAHKRKQERRENAVMITMLVTGLSFSGYFYYSTYVAPQQLPFRGPLPQVKEAANGQDGNN